MTTRSICYGTIIALLGVALGIAISVKMTKPSTRYSSDDIILMSRRTYIQPLTMNDSMLDALGSTIQRTWQPDSWSHELKESIIDQMVMKHWVTGR